MKYFGGCDVGSTYTKCVILDENGKMVADVTNRSKINPVQSAEIALSDAVSQVDGLNSAKDLAYLVGTGYGRNKVPFADENISEISCHAMGVHVTNPNVKAIIDIGGQDVKGIAIDTDGTVKNFAMNDKCAAGTGKFIEVMANRLGLTIEELFELAEIGNPISISSLCTVFAESEVINYMGEGRSREDLAAGVIDSVALKVATLVQRKEIQDTVIITGGFSNNEFFASLLSKKLGKTVTAMPLGRYAGAYGAALLAKAKDK